MFERHHHHQRTYDLHQLNPILSRKDSKTWHRQQQDLLELVYTVNTAAGVRPEVSPLRIYHRGRWLVCLEKSVI